MVSSESWNLGKQQRKDPDDLMTKVQDETSGCAFDRAYELIFNGRPRLFLPFPKADRTTFLRLWRSHQLSDRGDK